MSPSTPVVTRFAPSPTGYLHIGGARTALFNWLYAKHTGGTFLLRIEDTDRERSTQEAVDAILDGMTWLGMTWDGEAVSQAARADTHEAVALRLLAEGKAYRCTCSPEELTKMREDARAEGRPMRYDGRCRNKTDADIPPGAPSVVRLKAETAGETVIDDLIQGPVTVSNTEIDDFVLLRTDGTPTYMLAVVVDDHDMGVTHVIRGDDHLTNAFRQAQLYRALGWDLPIFAHMPLLHGADGKKLSKRHGALGIEAYRDEMGLLPEAVLNYLLRLGWGHGDDEIIPIEKAIEWFDVKDVGRAAARFDIDKMTNLNAHYLREADDSRLSGLILPIIKEKLGSPMAAEAETRLKAGMAGLKERAKTVLELAENAEFYCHSLPLPFTDKALKLLDPETIVHLRTIHGILSELLEWTPETLESVVRAFAETHDLKLGKVAQPLRAALTGSTQSPGLFDVMAVLGRDESMARINQVTDV